MLPIEKWQFLNGKALSIDVTMLHIVSSMHCFLQMKDTFRWNNAFYFLPSGLNGGLSALLPA